MHTPALPTDDHGTKENSLLNHSSVTSKYVVLLSINWYLYHCLFLFVNETLQCWYVFSYFCALCIASLCMFLGARYQEILFLPTPVKTVTIIYYLPCNELPYMEEIKKNLITAISPNVPQVCLPISLEDFTEFALHILSENHFLLDMVFPLNGSLPLEVMWFPSQVLLLPNYYAL